MGNHTQPNFLLKEEGSTTSASHVGYRLVTIFEILGLFGIYVIRNLQNGKVYVGKSKNIYIRLKQHITLLNTKDKNENRYLINAWHKYGKDNFDYYVIEYFDFDESKLKIRELYWMDSLNSLNRDHGYNLRKDTDTKCDVSGDTREKCRLAQIKRYKDPEERKKSSEASKKFWKERPELKKGMIEKVKKANRLYRIGKFDKITDELIEIFEYKNNISEKHPDFYIQAIMGCCQGTKKSYKGFNWHYVKLDSEERAK